MDRASIFVNFAVVRIDWLETDGTQEGLISAHEDPPHKYGNYASANALRASEKRTEHDAKFYIHRYRKSSDADSGIPVVGRLSRSHCQWRKISISLIEGGHGSMSVKA